MSHREAIKEKLRSSIPDIDIREDVSMADHTSFKVGGAADLLVIASGEDELCRILALMSEEGYPHMILGNGTNVLVKDGGYRGAMIKLGEGFQDICIEADTLECGASVLLSAAARAAMQEGLSGIEFASGIPGSIGGAVFMNAGAYGGEICDVLESVDLVSPDGSRRCSMTVDRLEMGYRKSAIQKTGEIITRARFRLKEGNSEEIRRTMAELTAKRNAKQPVNLPSAGSTFKRPEGHFAAKLIEDAGLKGLAVGGAQVSPLHSGFIVNRGNATAGDILQLMDIVRAKVMDDFGVELEPEVRVIGEE